MPDKQPTTLVIFGASGDLTRCKLVPALFRLCRQNRLPARFHTEAAPPSATYAPGSWGAAAADELLGRNGRFWRHGCKDVS